MRSVEIIGLAHGILLGAQYFAPSETYADDDYHELNIYLLIVCIRFTW